MIGPSPAAESDSEANFKLPAVGLGSRAQHVTQPPPLRLRLSPGPPRPGRPQVGPTAGVTVPTVAHWHWQAALRLWSLALDGPPAGPARLPRPCQGLGP